MATARQWNYIGFTADKDISSGVQLMITVQLPFSEILFHDGAGTPTSVEGMPPLDQGFQHSYFPKWPLE